VNNNTSEVFIIDSNILIEPYRTYYSFDFVPGFWNFIEQRIIAKRIVILDLVYNEIAIGTDILSKWIKAIPNLKPLNHKDAEYLKHYTAILNYIQTSKSYSSAAKRGWHAPTVADPFLIAVAIQNNHTVITAEKSNAGLNSTNPSSKVKIPDICTQFNVKCENLFYMLARLGFKIEP
jgi:hypothetical protein